MQRTRLLCATMLCLWIVTTEAPSERQGFSEVRRRFRPYMNLDVYAHQLACCAAPGRRVEAFVKQLDGSPVERLAEAYLQLRTDWKYHPDGPTELLQSAEETLGILQCHGDCEDFAVTLMALSRSIGRLRSRIVVCRSTANDALEQGHAFCEVLIATNRKSAEAVSADFAHQLGISHVETRADRDGVWVVLDFSLPDRRFAGEIYCFINADGSIATPLRSSCPLSGDERFSREHEAQLPF